MKKLRLLLPALLLFQAASAAERDTIPVYFATGKSVLTPGVQDQLADYIYRDVLHAKQRIQIIGYADYVGGDHYNDRLSRSRAQTVKRFLLGFGFSDKDIVVCIGKGEVPRPGMSAAGGSARDRRVDIVTDAPAPVPPPPPPVAAPAPKPVPPPPPAPGIPVPDLTRLRENETVVLQNIYFYPGRHAIRPESEAVLQALYQALAAHPAIRIGIEGHVCCIRDGVGDALDFDTREIALSVNRARAIYDYLVRKGIDRQRLSYKGFGATHRLVVEATEEDADKNRRVELRILK